MFERRGRNERGLTFDQLILQLLPLQLGHHDLLDQLTMLLIDLTQARLQLPHLRRQLSVGFPQRVELESVSRLLCAEGSPLLAELVL